MLYSIKPICGRKAINFVKLNGMCHHKLLCLLIFGLFVKASGGIEYVQLEAARHVRRGEDVVLTCNYDLGADNLYAVNWYRGSKEFYRFLPKESPPKQSFPFPGLLVDQNKSDEHRVYLKNVSFETSGTFRCSISAEGTFETLANDRELDVVVIDYNSPKLYLEKMGYQPGERGLANCVIEKTWPAPNITWFINGKLVNNISVITRVEPVDENSASVTTTTTMQTTTVAITSYRDTGTRKGSKLKKRNGTSEAKLTSSLSTLTFPIQSYSPLTIKCRGEMFSIYNETSTILIQPKAPLVYPYSTATPTKSQKKHERMEEVKFNVTKGDASTNVGYVGMIILCFVVLQNQS